MKKLSTEKLLITLGVEAIVLVGLISGVSIYSINKFADSKKAEDSKVVTEQMVYQGTDKDADQIDTKATKKASKKASDVPKSEVTVATADNTKAMEKTTMYVTSEDGVNLRSDATTESATILSLAYCTKVEAMATVSTSDSHDWVKVAVKMNGGELVGYIYGEFLSQEMPAVEIVKKDTVKTKDGKEIYAGNDTVVYPLVNVHLFTEKGDEVAWASLNTDGCYYDKNSNCYEKQADGTFVTEKGVVLVEK